MAVTVETVMRTCNNFFESGFVEGTFTIEDGTFTDETILQKSPFIAIEGSANYSGVYPTGDVVFPYDEEFEGRVWFLRPSPAFLMLCKEISDYDDSVPMTAPASESFGQYSFTRSNSGSSAHWLGKFGGLLKPFYRMFTEVHC